MYYTFSIWLKVYGTLIFLLTNKEYYSTKFYSDNKSTPYSKIEECLEIKSFYFDIFNEVLYEKQSNDDVTVADYPPYFFYNGQYYYAICHQPLIWQC